MFSQIEEATQEHLAALNHSAHQLIQNWQDREATRPRWTLPNAFSLVFNMAYLLFWTGRTVTLFPMAWILIFSGPIDLLSAHQYSPRCRFNSSNCHCHHSIDSGSHLRPRDCCEHKSIEIRRRWRVCSGFFVISQRARCFQCDQPGTCTYSVLYPPHARRRYFSNGLNSFTLM